MRYNVMIETGKALKKDGTDGGRVKIHLSPPPIPRAAQHRYIRAVILSPSPALFNHFIMSHASPHLPPIRLSLPKLQLSPTETHFQIKFFNSWFLIRHSRIRVAHTHSLSVSPLLYTLSPDARNDAAIRQTNERRGKGPLMPDSASTSVVPWPQRPSPLPGARQAGKTHRKSPAAMMR